MLLWVLGWIVLAWSSGVVWEFAHHRSPQSDLALARSVMVFLSLACATVPVFLLDLFGGIAQWAWDQYEWSVARWIVALAAALFLAITIPYGWLMVVMLQHIFSRIVPWFAPLGSVPSTTTTEATWTTWLLLAAATAWLIKHVLSIARHNPFYSYNSALTVLGLRRCLVGMCLMAFLRLLVPRRDFFQQAPVASWIPVLAIAILLHEHIPIRVFAAVIPALVIMLAVPFLSSFLAPPLWIFLGTSKYDSFCTFYELRDSWCRHGLTLLDRAGEGGQQFYSAWRASTRSSSGSYDPTVGRVWSLRTRPPMWTTAVRLLAAFVPVIVIDTRWESEQLKFEIDWLQRRDFMNKVYMIVSHEVVGEEHPKVPRRIDEETLKKLRWSDAGLVRNETSRIT